MIICDGFTSCQRSFDFLPCPSTNHHLLSSYSISISFLLLHLIGNLIQIASLNMVRSQVDPSYFRRHLPPNATTGELQEFLQAGFQPPVSHHFLPQIIASTVLLVVLVFLGEHFRRKSQRTFLFFLIEHRSLIATLLLSSPLFSNEGVITITSRLARQIFWIFKLDQKADGTTVVSQSQVNKG